MSNCAILILFKISSLKQFKMRFILLFFLCNPIMAQEITNNEIFLFDFNFESNGLRLENGENISKNAGYDNQPSFYSDKILLYARTIDGQTEIAAYDLEDKRVNQISDTSIGSEYSPSRIPGTVDVAAVRLDTTGLQRLYSYNWKTGESTMLHEDLKIGYFAFFKQDKVIAAVLSGVGMELVLLDLEENTKRNIVSHTGRSLHKIPGTESMSYTAINNQNEPDLYILDIVDQEPESFFLTTLPSGVQDYIWLDQNRILAGQDNKLFLYDMLEKSGWIQVADLSKYGLQNITRLAINEAGNKLAISAELKTD